MKNQLLFLFGLAILFQPVFSEAQHSSETEFGKEFSKIWERHKIYTLRLVDALDEKNLGYKPTPEIRTAAELLLHTAQTNYGFASVVRGGGFPVDSGVFNPSNKSKSEIKHIVAESFEFAEETANEQSKNELLKTVPWQNPLESSTSRTKKEVLHIMREHAAHTRGALTVYLRLTGVEPPSYID